MDDASHPFDESHLMFMAWQLVFILLISYHPLKEQ